MIDIKELRNPYHAPELFSKIYREVNINFCNITANYTDDDKHAQIRSIYNKFYPNNKI